MAVAVADRIGSLFRRAPLYLPISVAPVRHATAIRIPILLIVAETDTQAPVAPALRVAELAGPAELHRSKGGHYDVYEGGLAFDDVLHLEVEFLRRHAGLNT
jgi:pimeloyl-ACP methyl ester carboxylesterase